VRAGRQRPEGSGQSGWTGEERRSTPRQPHHTFQIGELAQLTGLSQRTIRYYEEIGLLDTVRRQDGGKRIYTGEDLRRLRFIKKLKALGLSLAEMQELESAYMRHRTNAKVLPRLMELLDRRTAEIDERIEMLASLRHDIREYRAHLAEKLAAGDEGAQDDGTRRRGA
jgi:DNA-binding transcriptional MerR regulator